MPELAALHVLPHLKAETETHKSPSATKAPNARPGSFYSFSEEEKIMLISRHFGEIMRILGLDLKDESLKGTPRRVAKMYVRELFSGLNPDNAPAISLFDNSYGYNEMLLEKNITVQSTCEHHFLPIHGVAHVAYFAKDKVIGLSKINRLVQYYSRRPQVQERLTAQIAAALQDAIGTDDVAVVIHADHHCVMSRGVCDTDSSTYTAHYTGKFREESVKQQFLSLIRL